MLKVLIADDERKVCQLIEKLIDWKSQEMQVIATAENGMEALEVIQKSQLFTLRVFTMHTCILF